MATRLRYFVSTNLRNLWIILFHYRFNETLNNSH